MQSLAFSWSKQIMKKQFFTRTYNGTYTTDTWGFNTFEGEGGVELRFGAIRNPDTGEIRFELAVPGAEALVFPEDLPRLVRAFGWGMAALSRSMEAEVSPAESFATWARCCRVMCAVDYVFRHPDYDPNFGY
jgi:hypothetical protein